MADTKIKRKKFSIDGVKLSVLKSKRPSFSSHGGRTFDTFSFFIDGEKTSAYLDTTWGTFHLFSIW